MCRTTSRSYYKLIITITLWRRGGIRTPGTGFSQYNGLANSRFHTLLFGINNLCSGEMPYIGTKQRCLGLSVQRLCNRSFALNTKN